MPSATASPQGKKIFAYRRPAGMGLPVMIQVVMFIAFGLPAVACVLFTFQELPQNPWLFGLYLVSLFPLAVLYLLTRLMSRYALAVYENGDLEITFPFSREVLPAGSVARVSSDSRYVAATASQWTWFRFVGQEDKILLSLAGSAFPQNVLADFLAAAKSVNPKLQIEF